MLNKRRSINHFLICIVLALCGAGCRKPDNTTISIGMLAPLTGAGARFGESQRNGVQLAIDEINSQGGIEGKPIRLVVEDTKTEPPTAVTAFLRLAENRDVVAIVGSAASLDVPAYLPNVDKAAIPHILPVAVLPQITESGSRWTFRNALNDRIAAQRMADFVVHRLGATKVALLIEDSAFGETGLRCGEQMEKLGVTPLAIERFKRGDLDIRPQITKLRALGCTHIQFWGYYAEFAIVAKQMKELEYTAQLMGNQAPVNEKTIQLGGDAVEGTINICLFVPTKDSPAVGDFVKRYREQFGSTPDTWAAQSYDGMMLLAEAMRKGGANRVAVRDALAATRDFPGITGTISFSESGDAEFRDTSIIRVSGGLYVPFDPDETK